MRIQRSIPDHGELVGGRDAHHELRPVRTADCSLHYYCIQYLPPIPDPFTGTGRGARA